ncbi:hypothetical protein IFM89_032638 [Coptis chinensis]|uniref:Protein PHOTOPERIOD-INDEPENDENT EARLY FLOWERING 1 n=1 Tax=Coptis chinensis TaxID=261450 RepID=A0A835HRG2_9MAGN|nr:hypothetical protein IFM89_032638 [Coptis chinensis]
MASKGPRSKLDHETRARRQKALEAPRDRRPKAHWDHVLEEMLWLSKDFEAERKWKLALAKKVAIRASKNALDPATRGEKKVKEEEQRLRKVALNISKDVKKFWIKIEKLVLYKHQLEVEEKKKKALDKQLDFLLGQTERYSTMLAENLVDMPYPCTPICPDSAVDQPNGEHIEDGTELVESPEHCENMDIDGDYDIQSEDESEDDEHTIEEDEALITADERQEELEALHNEIDIPLEELLKRYNSDKVSMEESPLNGENVAEPIQVEENLGKGNHCFGGGETDTSNSCIIGHHSGVSNGEISLLETDKVEVDTSQSKNQLKGCEKLEKQLLVSCSDEQEDGDYILAADEEKDDETTMSEEEELAKTEENNPLNESVLLFVPLAHPIEAATLQIELLQKESEISVEELLARYKKDFNSDEDADEEPGYTSTSSEDLMDPQAMRERQVSPIPEVVAEQDGPGEFKQISEPDAKMDEVEHEMKSDEGKESEDRIADAAAAARSAQPTGNTFSTMKVRTASPFLLKHCLREYQHIGLDWLVTMYEKRLNGILADEMGLGKTIMTISLLAHLACEKGIWGPHLIVVPTSVMLNWETEFLKWCPAFKILTYFGSAKERKFKRQGWMKPNFFHVCITTYRLVIQDSKAFKRKKWKYLILDEAHLIKNWKSQRWQTLLNFNSKRRILLTGTPLQNDLMELWSLMHFLMPHIFQSHQEFKDWFSNPISVMVEGQESVNKEVIDRLHNVLRPFILRRLKRDVEKQLPGKFEHVIYCRLSRRQRNLYEDFIASSETQATLASTNFFGMISVIMQLRKVCNHPDLFEGRPIISSFDMGGIDMQLSSSICNMLFSGPLSTVDLSSLGFLFTHLEFSMSSWESDEVQIISTPSSSIKERASLENVVRVGPRLSPFDHRKRTHGSGILKRFRKPFGDEKEEKKQKQEQHPLHGGIPCNAEKETHLADIVLSPVERFNRIIKLVECFMFAIPAARAPSPACWCSKTEAPVFLHPSYKTKCTEIVGPLLSPVRPAIVRRQVYFPDRRLIQFDCGKLQELAVLLRRLKSEGHRALIFTQMTKMLDLLEAFINFTIEENILKKANQKRTLDDLVIQSGDYNTDFFKKLDPMELFSGHKEISAKSVQKEKNPGHGADILLSNADVEAALKHAEDEADYMALKKVEQEEAVDNQEFTDEAIVRLEDDEFGNEDDMKFDEKISGDQSGWITVVDKDVGTSLNGSDQNGGKTLTLSKEDDCDMLADVKQLAAAAAAAGQASSSFDYQLRPIDRYAMRFLDLWDPVIDRSAIDSQISFEEREWELDRIEKFKEDMEADIDDDEEPLVYERWDAEFATKAYKDEVEALAQRQLLEDLEYEAREAEEAAEGNSESARKEILTERKPKSKKKAKKTKFKSLKKGGLAFERRAAHEDPPSETMSIDYDDMYSEMADYSDSVLSHSPVQKKRKKVHEEKLHGKNSKRTKKGKSSYFGLYSNMDNQHGSKEGDYVVTDVDHKPVNRSKMGGKVYITVMPVKRILVIKPEKLKKKGNIWSRDCNASPDSWMSQEDVILCAVVHEYGSNWSLVSDILYGMTAGGFYRGRFHHPVHCCERFRELFQRYVLSTVENPNNEKAGNAGPGKAIFKVTEDSVRTLLDVASELPDNELLLQKHFTAVMSSVWRARSRVDRWQSVSSSLQNNYFRKSIQPPRKFNFAVSGQSSKLVSAALRDVNTKEQDAVFPPRQNTKEALTEVDKLEVTLELLADKEDFGTPLPSTVNLSIFGSDPPLPTNSNGGVLLLDSSWNAAENRFRVASNACFDGQSLDWASSAFSSGDFIRSRSVSKQQSLGKNKAPMSDPVKSSKIKLLRIGTQPSEEQHPICKLTFPSPKQLGPTDAIVKFDRSLLNGLVLGGTDDKGSSKHHERMSEGFMPDMDIFEAVPHHYDPDFICGLEDCTILPDFTDIG